MIRYRPIIKSDNQQIANIIRTNLASYGLNLEGTVYTDPTTDNLFELFQTPKSHYWIATADEEVVGGCGVYPTKGLPKGYGELVKLYVAGSHKGLGIGKALMQHAINRAKELGYTHLYLESFPELGEAVRLYERMDFKVLRQPLGDSGHFACNLWMVCEL